MRKSTAAMTAVSAAIAAALGLPAAAPAATVTITGDDGAPVALAPGVPAAIRNMDVDLSIALGGTEKYYTAQVAGPVAAAASPRTCSSTQTVPMSLDYQGNGLYTVTVTTYPDSKCTTGAKTATYQFSVNAGVAVTPPGGAVLTRRPNSFVSATYQVPVAQNPGALSTNLHYARGGVAGPDGAISGASTEAFVDRTTGTAPVRFDAPGTYLLVARATGYTGAAGQFFSPWSAPVTVRAFAPFDFKSGSPSFPDSRGPRYKLRVVLQEKSARGKVKIAMGRGNRGRLRSIGSAKLRRGKFTKTFTQHRTGVYRVRFSFKGSATTAPGTITQKIRITRRIF